MFTPACSQRNRRRWCCEVLPRRSLSPQLSLPVVVLADPSQRHVQRSVTGGLKNAYLFGADLARRTTARADLLNVDLHEADLAEADLTGACLGEDWLSPGKACLQRSTQCS